MITVLDIDVDLFVDPRQWGSSVRMGSRAEDVTAWPPECVCEYIRRITDLSDGSKLPGACFETHEQILGPLAKIRSPVHLYHLDAHADLGIGQTGYKFYSEFLAIEPSLRGSRLDEFLPREGDFLLYAIACGYVGAIDYVTHPEIFAREPDIPIKMDRWREKYSDGFLDLRRFDGTAREYGCWQGARTLDCSIPLRMHDRDGSQPEGVSFDYLFITLSPSYTPTASDCVVQALQEEFLQS